MVRLTMSTAMVAAINHLSKTKEAAAPAITSPDEPSLEDPAVGKPITHSQIMAISRALREITDPADRQYDLDSLLRGSRVYIDPPKPKPEPVRQQPPLS